LMCSGYLISTADGRGIWIFELVEVPAVTALIENQEDIAGEIHFILAWCLIGLVAVHAAAAFKHHFINKDDTLKKMLGLRQ
jgi:cytochrome b561